MWAKRTVRFSRCQNLQDHFLWIQMREKERKRFRGSGLVCRTKNQKETVLERAFQIVFLLTKSEPIKDLQQMMFLSSMKMTSALELKIFAYHQYLKKLWKSRTLLSSTFLKFQVTRFQSYSASLINHRAARMLFPAFSLKMMHWKMSSSQKWRQLVIAICD